MWHLPCSLSDQTRSPALLARALSQVYTVSEPASGEHLTMTVEPSTAVSPVARLGTAASAALSLRTVSPASALCG